VDEEMIKLLKKVNEKPTTEDSIDTFAKAMASKLKRISELDKKAAAMCKLDIHLKIKLLEQ